MKDKKEREKRKKERDKEREGEKRERESEEASQDLRFVKLASYNNDALDETQLPVINPRYLQKNVTT